MPRKSRIDTPGALHHIIARGIERTDILQTIATGKEPWRVKARSLFCYGAVRDVGITMAELSRRLKTSLSGVALSVKRGEKITQDYGYALIDHKTGKLKDP